VKYFLGVDSGGTKIAVALRSDSGAVRVARVPGANLEVKGVKAVYALIKQGVDQLACGSKIELSGARFCLCGIDFPRDAEMVEPYFRQRLKRDFNYTGPMSFENDAFAALRVGTAARPGFIVSLGTGFTIAAIDARGRERLVCDYQVRNLLLTMTLGLSSAAHGLLPGNKPSRLLGEIMKLASCKTPHDLLARLWAAAGRLLVVAEPVRNLSQSRSALARWAARALTRTVDGRVHTFRYTEAALLEAYRRARVPVSRLDRTPGGRELIVTSLKTP